MESARCEIASVIFYCVRFRSQRKGFYAGGAWWGRSISAQKRKKASGIFAARVPSQRRRNSPQHLFGLSLFGQHASLDPTSSRAALFAPPCRSLRRAACHHVFGACAHSAGPSARWFGCEAPLPRLFVLSDLQRRPSSCDGHHVFGACAQRRLVGEVVRLRGALPRLFVLSDLQKIVNCILRSRILCWRGLFS